MIFTVATPNKSLSTFTLRLAVSDTSSHHIIHIAKKFYVTQQQQQQQQQKLLLSFPTMDTTALAMNEIMYKMWIDLVHVAYYSHRAFTVVWVHTHPSRKNGLVVLYIVDLLFWLVVSTTTTIRVIKLMTMRYILGDHHINPRRELRANSNWWM